MKNSLIFFAKILVFSMVQQCETEIVKVKEYSATFIMKFTAF